MADEKYEQKVKDMQKYIPFLENLIKKLKSNKDERREGQLQKMEMLYNLLTNKDKKLQLKTLEKCEAVLVKLYSKVEKNLLVSQGSSASQANASEPSVDLAAPASPSNQESYIEYHDPIVIPTERRRTPSPPKHPIIANNEALFGRNARNDNFDFQSRQQQTPELFRRRSPNRDRGDQFEELRRKFEAPVHQELNRPQRPQPMDFRRQGPRPVVNSIRSPGPFPSEVLKSPPISLDDLKDYLDESNPRDNRNQHDPRFPSHNMGTYNDLMHNNSRADQMRNNSRPDPIHSNSRPDPMHNNSRPDAMHNNSRPDPRCTSRNVDPRFGDSRNNDPRFNRQDSTGMMTQNLPSNQPLDAGEPVRLAYKYNPHPRREVAPPPSRSNDFGNSKPDNSRNMNTLPSLNLSDPRLRNRPLSSAFPIESNMMNHMPPNLGHNMQSPMSPMASFDGCQSPIYGAQPFFQNFQQQQQQSMHMQRPMHTPPNVFMGQQNRFQSTQPPQPRTYGEYKKIMQRTPPASHVKKPDSSIAQRNVPSIDSAPKTSDISSPSLLDNLYRNSSLAGEVPSTTQGFKIPKIRKESSAEAPKTDTSVAQKQQKTSEDNWDDLDAKQQKTPDDSWDDLDAKQQKTSEDNWDDLDASVKPKKNESAKNKKIEHVKSKKEEPVKGKKEEPVKNKKEEQVKSKKDEPIKSKKDEPVKTKKEQPAKSKKEVSKANESKCASIGNKRRSSSHQKRNQEELEQISTDSEGDAILTLGRKPKSNRLLADDDDSENASSSTRNEQPLAKVEKVPADIAETVSKKPADEPSAKTTVEKKKPMPTRRKSIAGIQEISSPLEEITSDNAEVSKPEETSSELPAPTKRAAPRSRSKSVADVKRPVISDDEAEAVEKTLPTRPKRKRGPPTTRELPDKIAKTTTAKEADEASEEIEKPAEPQPAITSENDIEMKEDGVVSDTIINSDISSKNIIEGRRTRGVRHSLPEETTPKKTPPKTSPPAKRGRKSAPAAAQQSVAQPPVEEESEECAVSSTTLETKSEPKKPPEKKKPGPKPRARKQLATEPKSLEIEETPAEKEKPAAASSSTDAASTSTTAAKDEITKEWLEGFLLNLFNPSMMSTGSVLTMLEKVLDSTKFAQVKKILQPEATPAEDEQPSSAAAASTSMSSEPKETTARPTKGRRKNELDRLNEDIRDMFISQGVITATGRRMCTALSEKRDDDTESISSEVSTAKSQQGKATATPKTTPSTKAVAKPVPVKATVTAPVVLLSKAGKPRDPRGRKVGSKNKKKKKAVKRGRPFSKPQAQAATKTANAVAAALDEQDDDENMDIDIDYIEEPLDDDDDETMPVASASKENTAEEEKLMEIVVGKTATLKTNKDNNETIEILDTSAEGDALENVGETPAPAPVPPKGKGKGKRGRRRRVTTAPVSDGIVAFKNIHPEMHTRSEYLKQCVLCSYVGRHMPNHYVHTHRNAEVFISRLPPIAHRQLIANEGNIPMASVRKPPNKTLYTHICPFCGLQNSFTRVGWVDHFGTHTGEYTFKCSDCNHMFNFKTEVNRHILKCCPKAQPMRLRSFIGVSRQIYATVCELCNFIQMEKKHVVQHLQTQHDCSDELMKEIVLLDCMQVDCETNGDPKELVDISPLRPTAKPDPILSSIEKPTATEQNLRAFVSNEQNDINLDTNIIDFMRDVSFSATGSPPRESTMSVVDRINERFKNVSSESQSISEAQQKPEPALSMTDRLSKRFSEANSSQGSISSVIESINTSEQHPAEPIADRLTKRFSEANSSQESISSFIESINTTEQPQVEPVISKIHEEHRNSEGSENDCIIISDGEEPPETSKSKAICADSVVITIKDENSESAPNPSKEDNDDDDWEDIEDSPPSPVDIEPEPKPNATEKKKNKTIYATLSRLYASIAQTKSKKKPEAPSPQPSTSTAAAAETTTTTIDHVDQKKLESRGMHRIDRLGFSKQKANDHIKYHCLVNKCSFLYSDIPDGLENHVIFEHSDLLWNGYCQTCQELVVTDKNIKLIRELRHMQEVHVNRPGKPETNATTAVGEDTKKLANSSPTLKIRQLPGDNLSLQTTATKPICPTGTSTLVKPSTPLPPPLQIASAVSLNKASDIWKPRAQKNSVPIVIKQVFSGDGSPSIMIHPSKTTPESSAQSAVVSGLKIAKVMSIAGPKKSPSTVTSNSVNSSTMNSGILLTSDETNFKITEVTGGTTAMPAAVESQAQLEMPSPKFVTTPLKPWTVSSSVKNDECISELLRDTSLFAFYKCMGNHCSFVTSMAENMVFHLNNHAAHEHRSRSVNGPTCNYAWLECSYCNFRAAKISDLMKHIYEKHKNNIFQCLYCFYRSCDENNIVAHLGQYHPLNEISVLLCPGEKPSAMEKFKEYKWNLWMQTRKIKCYDCPKTFMNFDEFTVHLTTHVHPTAPNYYQCAQCLPAFVRIAKHQAIAHLRQKHYINFLECVYCTFSACDKAEMVTHLSNCHASNLSFCYERGDHILEREDVFAKTDNGRCSVALFEKTIAEGRIRKCPYTKQQLSKMNAGLKLQEVVIDPVENTDTKSVQKPLGFEIASVQSMAVVPKPVPHSSPVQCSNPVLPTPVPSTSPASIPTQPVKTVPATPSPTTSPAIAPVAGPSPPSITTTPTNAEQEKQSQLLLAACDIVKNTGVNIDELYRCGMPDCSQVFTDSKDFRTHLCDGHPESGSRYSCYYCDAVFTKAFDCVNHYNTHERHRYFCFTCFKTAISNSSLTTHLARDHGIRSKHLISYALIKHQINARRDFFFVCPIMVSATDVLRFGDRLLKHWEKTKWSQMKKSFTSDEVDELPRQAIFIEELYCGICQYKTKVRTNLVRHLQFHKHEVDVASTDPVNPVPCLNSNERHFDKMTNLACSSHEGKVPVPAAAAAAAALKGSPAKVDVPDSADKNTNTNLPKFVPNQKRFTCSVTECKYLTLSEANLKQHLITLHADEKNYKCPHCKVMICANKMCPDKIVIHLRFHNKVLYQCRSCSNLHYHKPVMDRHVNDKCKSGYAIIVRQTESEVKSTVNEIQQSATTTTATTTVLPIARWQCTLCKARTVTQSQIITHVSANHGINYRYQCSKCNFGGALLSAISDHAAKKHINKLAEVLCFYVKLSDTATEEAATLDTTPLWRRDPNKIKNIRGILMDEEPVSATASSPVHVPAAVDEPIVNAVAMESAELPDTSRPAEMQPEPIQAPLIITKGPIHKYEPCKQCSSLTEPDLSNHIFEKHWSYHDSSDQLNKLFKFICYYCKISFQSTQELRKHWLQVHRPVATKTSKDEKGRALWFYIAKRYQCSRCEKYDDYREIAIHHFLEHSNESFAIRDIENAQKCGHCSFTFEANNITALAVHYKTMHPVRNHQLPIPPTPAVQISNELLTRLSSIGNDQELSYRCSQCFMILVGRDACNLHVCNNHDDDNIVDDFTAVTERLFKCPMCLFNTADEMEICQHIYAKLHTKNFNPPPHPAPASISSKIWPYFHVEIVFPNGFVTQKYRTLNTPYGSDSVIRKFVESKAQSYESTTESLETNNVDDTSETESTESNSRSMKKRKRPSTKIATIDQFESDDEYRPSKPKKKYKSAAVSTAAAAMATTEIAAETKSPDESKSLLEPFSAYGTKPIEPDLSKIVANIVIAGVDVMIPASDFNKIYKKDIEIKLQKMDIEEISSTVSSGSTTTNSMVPEKLDDHIEVNTTEPPEQLLADPPGINHDRNKDDANDISDQVN